VGRIILRWRPYYVWATLSCDRGIALSCVFLLVDGLIWATFSFDEHLKMDYLSIHCILYRLQNVLSKFS
jgi:hypothetical protein